jgi:diguanylate cyclase (GGDEF)-like protein
MNDDRARSYPAIELLAGSIAAVGWVVGLDVAHQLTTTQVVQAMSTGLVGAAAAALAALVVRLASRSSQDEFDRLTNDARRDALTGLHNRPELFRLLEESIEVGRQEDMVVGVLFLDLDRFKTVNDSMGHEAGDELLRIVAKRLESTVRSTDVVARLGGDEFVVLCRDLLAADSVVAMARQILRRFDDPVSIGGLDHRIGTSIGVAVALPGDTRTADELVRDADAAMYRAKSTKSGVSVFDDAHRLQIADRLDIERDLRLAIERAELTVHYQPIVDTVANRLYGFEALVRWQHPDRGELSPAEFLPIAGDAGMIGWIGEFVLREACAQAALWNRTEPAARHVKMSVNLSEPQLADPNLARRVAEVLAWSGLPPEQLVLEITEDVIVDHLDGLDALRQLRSLGVELSIDDFGTGQSSLGYVKDFEMVTVIKIDKRFVRDMRAGDVDRAIVEAVMSMAGALGKRVVAEGVEFEDQVRELASIGIHLMQGYLFGRTISPSEVAPMLALGDGAFLAGRFPLAGPRLRGTLASFASDPVAPPAAGPVAAPPPPKPEPVEEATQDQPAEAPPASLAQLLQGRRSR